MYLACATAKHHDDYDDDGESEGVVDFVIMMLHKIPSNSFAKSFFLFVWRVSFRFGFFFPLFFLSRVCNTPKQICSYQKHGRHSGYHGD